MTTAYDYLIGDKDTFKKIKEKFPDFVEFSKTVEVIPWQEEFNVADRNPELLEELKFWNTLLEAKLITPEEYDKNTQHIKQAGYISRTEGLSIIEDNVISFRDKNPSIYVITHEIGHCYFKEPDTIWNAAYGGGESLFWLAIKKDLKISEDTIRYYHNLLKNTINNNIKAVETEILSKLSKLELDVYPHIGTYMLAAGTIPNMLSDLSIELEAELLENLENNKWQEIKVEREDITSFFLNMLEGMKWGDPFYRKYFEAMFLE
jgi:uncharacterized protein Usg